MTQQPGSVAYPRKWSSALWALVAGSATTGLIQGLLRLPLPGTIFGRELVVLCTAGNVLATLLAWPLVWALARLRQPPMPPRTSSAFWIGWGIGLVPIAANFLGPGFSFWALAVGALVCIAAPGIGARIRPSQPLVSSMLFLAVAAWPLGAVAFGAPPLRFGPQEMPDPSPGAALRVSAAAPDVILVSIDTLRADILAAPGAETRFPTLQRLAREGAAGVAHSSSNQTLPGHVGMLTGTTAIEHGVRSNRGWLPAELRLVSEDFKEAGWATVGVVSNGLLRRAAGFARGFDLYDDDTVAHAGAFRAFLGAVDHRTWLGWMVPDRAIRAIVAWGLLPGAARELRDANGAGAGKRVSSRALGYLGELAEREQPYFLFLHFMDPHTPYGAPEGFRGRFTSDLPALSEEYGGGEERVSSETLAKVETGLRAGDPRAQEATEYLRGLYREEVAFVDHCLGEVLARVESRGRPTLVVVTSDHGEHFGEHDLMEHANSLYEPLLRVPIWVWGQGVGDVLPAPQALDQVAPFLRSRAGLGGGVPPAAGAAIWSCDERQAALLQGGAKWIFEWAAGTEAPAHSAFFDLEADPAESKDLGGEAVPAGMRRMVGEQWRPAGPAAAPLSPEHEALLESLGYAGGGAGD